MSSTPQAVPPLAANDSAPPKEQQTERTSNADVVPDWDQLSLDLRCPKCDYNLHMLTVARCPECGLAFRWQDLLDAANSKITTGGFFEFEWRRRPIGSFLDSVAAAVTPWSLWRRMPLAAKPQVGALLAMIPLTLLLLLAMSTAVDYAWYEYVKLRARTFFGQTNFSGFLFWDSWDPFGECRNLLTLLLILIAPWLAIQVFRQTASRYRIRWAHVVRILVFTWIGIVVSKCTLEWVCTLAEMPCLWFWSARFPQIVWQVIDTLPTLMIVASLGFGVRNYLKIRGAWVWVGLILALTVALLTFIETILALVYFGSFENPYWGAVSDWFPPLRDASMVVEWWLRWRHGYA